MTHRMRRRRWTQFSLRAALVAMSAVCMGLGWSVHQARRQREAIHELHRLHVAVLYHPESDARRERVDPGAVERLLGMAYRESVDYVGFQHAQQLFDDPRGMERALALLVRLSGLKRLNLEGMPVSDDDLGCLRSLVGLRKLNLMYTQISDAGVAGLRGALPDCEILR
ncbi:MAG TPA: hypothetical protein VFW87_02095 [Pirellulales bacterium]|nr:hypothetical protein [Pirellulales bacterium]